ncbi:MAG: M20/M25/M40 family metallo-hydrolase [Rhodospirillales bacterium]|jgi:acetylornithine deacetylase|nr:M20/M25/M40 family metallo-hydrolase [Rhodospirillales bacterium]HJO96439.1 M20/M25/M40 family metallo-hydrolase [Rhodospirillales bacterium]
MTELLEQVASRVDRDRVVELAQGVLRIPSLSDQEEEVARYLAQRMEEIGMDVELQPVAPNPYMNQPSVNAIGRLNGTGGGPTLLFSGHMDHNPVCDGWTKDPFGAVVEDGWIYGFMHMKSANAAYIAGLEAVIAAGIPLTGDVVIANVCGELRGGAGTCHALEHGLEADFFVLGEPSELELALSHTASIVVRIHTLGQMKHFATFAAPGFKGVNAVEKMAPVIAALTPSHTLMAPRNEGGWLTFEACPGFEGLPQLCIGSIRGGISRDHDASRPGLLPDVCSITVDIRMIPGMTRDSVRADLERLLDGLAADDPDFRYELEFMPDFFPYPFQGDREAYVVRSLAAAHQHVTGEELRETDIRKFGATDASFMARAGIKGLIYGPAGRYLSRPDERGRVDDLVTAAKVYACIIADICTKTRAEVGLG